MSTGQMGAVVEYIRKMVRPRHLERELSDGQLLQRFLALRDAEAFAVLIERHGPLVLTVCRRILQHEQDTEDAFQATFLVLLRRARSIAKRESLASWLHGVAHRVALRAKVNRTRRRVYEQRVEPQAAPDCLLDVIRRDLRSMLDGELRHLPQRCREAFILCYMEGKTNEEAAQLLGCPKGTVFSRLARAREILRSRLARRGLTASAALIGTMLSQDAITASVPANLVGATTESALGFVSGSATAALSANAVLLAEKVSRSFVLARLLTTAASFILAGLLGVGTTVLLQGASDNALAEGDGEPPRELARPESAMKNDRTEMEGTWARWETVMRTINGRPLPPERKKFTSVVTGDKLIQNDAEGFVDDVWFFTLDPTRKPKWIDLTSLKIGKFPGIYLLEGDTLRIHIGYDGKRPTEFPAAEEGIVLKRVSRAPEPAAHRFPNPPGAFWMIQPGTPSPLMTTLGITYFFDMDRDGAAVITMAHPVTGQLAVREYRPVLFDAAKKRYLPKRAEGGASGRRGENVVGMYRWRMDPKELPAKKVVLLGIEGLTTDSYRAAAREALEKAIAANIEVLPWPEVGEPFLFKLTTIDGKKISAQDLKGKVVLIDCWATWCSPCMALMAELKALYEKWHKDGLEIVGVSFDREIETVRKTCKSQNLPWPQVWVPSDDGTRELWQEANRLDALPRLLLIDRDGILRAESHEKLEEEITKLLKKSTR
jgi:RNA polymerase sigma factor (sigma-70 family)